MPKPVMMVVGATYLSPTDRLSIKRTGNKELVPALFLLSFHLSALLKSRYLAFFTVVLGESPIIMLENRPQTLSSFKP